MYERSAIVLEKYMEKILKLNKTYNLKKNTENYESLVNEIEKYQLTTNKDIKVIQDFDETVRKIENIQREQEKLYKINKKLEEDRAQLFTELGEDFKILEVKLKKIENLIEKNNERIKELREQFITNLKDFSEKQKYRNKCDKERRVSEARIIKHKEQMLSEFKEIDVQDMVNLKDFIASEKDKVKQEAIDIMIKNGKNERVPFDQDVLKKAVNNRIDIAEKEAECYILIYDRMKKILAEADIETIKLDRYKKALKDTTVKLAFLGTEKEYIVGFLDYERMTAISGRKQHKSMMIEACNNFELDMMQIKKLYELLLKETTKKATKTAYKELYNKNYLKNIEDKEKNFEEEANNVNIKAGTLINSNYWRIEGIKNIYMVFQKEISEKYEKDLSEYSIEEPNENEKKYSNIDYSSEDYEDDYDEEYEDEEEYNENDYDEDYEDEEEYDEDDYDEEYEDEEEYDEDDYDEEYEDEEEYDEDGYDEEYEDEEEYNENDYDEEYDDEEKYDKNDYEDYEDEEVYSDRISDSFNVEDLDDLDQIIKNSRREGLQKSKKSKKSKKINNNTHKSNKTVIKSAKDNKTNKGGKAKTSKTNKKDNKGLLNKFFKK